MQLASLSLQLSLEWHLWIGRSILLHEMHPTEFSLTLSQLELWHRVYTLPPCPTSWDQPEPPGCPGGWFTKALPSGVPQRCIFNKLSPLPATHSISSLGTARLLKFKHSVTDYKLQPKLLIQRLPGNWFCSLTRTSASQSPLSELLAPSHCPFFLIKLTVSHCLAHILLAHLTKPHLIPLAPPAARLWGAAAEKSHKSRVYGGRPVPVQPFLAMLPGNSGFLWSVQSSDTQPSHQPPTTPSRQTTSFTISQIKQKQLGENYLQLPATKEKFSELMVTFSFFLSAMMEATSLLPGKTDPPLGLWVWFLSAFLSTVLNNKPLILGLTLLSAAQLLELSRLISLPHSHLFFNSLKSSLCSHQSAGIYLATDKTW